MAEYHVEATFVGQFWAATTSDEERDQALAWEASAVQPEWLESEGLRALFDLLRVRFVENKPNDTADVQTVIASEPRIRSEDRTAAAERWGGIGQLRHHVEAVKRSAQLREAAELVQKTFQHIETKGDVKQDGGRAMAERLSFKLMDLYGRRDGGGWKDRDTLIDEVIARSDRGEVSGIEAPYPKLAKACNGPWVGGDTIGITGYSNSGKSLLLANLFLDLVRRGYPCIVFPTEMGNRFLDRVGALAAGVDQAVAEKQQWKGRAEQLERFQHELHELRGLEWAMVDRGEIGPAEVATAIRILRRKWAGQTVVAMVDHVHRLHYPKGVSADEQNGVGAATRMFKNMAVEDGHLVNILLYQPRKPSNEKMKYRPVSAMEIRGHSEVWNELDIHMSPYRAWVRTTAFRTAWGKRMTKLDQDGRPEMVAPDSDNAKVADEHFFLKIDKRRVGGEGPGIYLNIHGPSGRIYEEARVPERQTA